MEPEWLSDVELVELVHVGGESAHAALTELSERHFDAVRAFAVLCTNDDSAADRLAERAWQRAVWPQGTSGARTMRTHALASVLQVAAEVANTDHLGALDADLAVWLGTRMSAPDLGSSGSDFPVFHHDLVITRAFHALSANLQTVMWHHFVEHAEDGLIGRLLGSASPESQEISVLIRRAYRDFYYAYEQIHHNGMTDDCRRFHRMVMAYADHKDGNATDVIPHLQQCDYCSRAVADLERMAADLGELLAEAVLPFGGHDYAASRRAECTAATIAVPGEERANPPQGAGAGASSPHPNRYRSHLRRPTWGVLGVVGHAERKTGPSSIRARRLTQVIASLGACSLAVAFAYAQGYGPKLPQRSGEPPVKEVPGAPAPSKSGAPGPSGSPTDSPSPTGSAGRSTKPPSGNGDGSPGVRGAALEWLFERVKGGVTADSSGNNRDGTLIGDPLPKPLKENGIAFFGQQSVTSRGPVFDTDSSFSISARVKLRNKDGYQTVASQDGSGVSSFQLQYDPVEDRWEMRMHREDTQTSRADEAESDAAPRAGRWTSLTGVYDAPDEQIRLYVDGQLEDTVHRDGDRSSEGNFAVGRARLGNQFIRGFQGTINKVRAFPEALTGAQARNLALEK